MKYEIIAQDMCIGWKEWDEKGKPTTSIVEYDSLLDLLKGEGFRDEDDDYDEEVPDSEYNRMLEALEEDGGFMMNDHDMCYWHEPEPCDSYLTYGTQYTIRILNEEALAKLKAVKDKFNASHKANNKKKWDEFLKENKGTSYEDTLENLLNNYQFPAKLIER